MASVEKSIKPFYVNDSLEPSKESISSESEFIKIYKGKRSNRYYRAPIDYDSFPKGVEFMSRGNRYYHDIPNKDDCSVYIYSYVPMDNKGIPVHVFKHCNKSTCYYCGFFAANKAGLRIARKLLRLKGIPMSLANFLRINNIPLTKDNLDEYRDSYSPQDWRRIKFLSLNFYNSETKKYLKTNWPMEVGVKDNNVDFSYPEGMTFDTWFEKVQKNAAVLLKNEGFPGFTTILHVDRINEISGKREWSCHMHCFGLGYLPNINDFMKKYSPDNLFENGVLPVDEKELDEVSKENGFSYTSFDDVHFDNKKEMASLIPRISYYLNHAASYNKVITRKKDSKSHKAGTTYNRVANIYRSYGILSNNMSTSILTIERTIRTNDLGSPFVAKDLSPFLKS